MQVGLVAAEANRLRLVVDAGVGIGVRVRLQRASEVRRVPNMGKVVEVAGARGLRARPEHAARGGRRVAHARREIALHRAAEVAHVGAVDGLRDVSLADAVHRLPDVRLVDPVDVLLHVGLAEGLRGVAAVVRLAEAVDGLLHVGLGDAVDHLTHVALAGAVDGLAAVVDAVLAGVRIVLAVVAGRTEGARRVLRPVGVLVHGVVDDAARAIVVAEPGAAGRAAADGCGARADAETAHAVTPRAVGGALVAARATRRLADGCAASALPKATDAVAARAHGAAVVLAARPCAGARRRRRARRATGQ